MVRRLRKIVHRLARLFGFPMLLIGATEQVVNAPVRIVWSSFENLAPLQVRAKA